MKKNRSKGQKGSQTYNSNSDNGLGFASCWHHWRCGWEKRFKPGTFYFVLSSHQNMKWRRHYQWKVFFH